METNIEIILAAIVLVLAALAATLIFFRKRRADRLRSQFGPEYERTVEEAGGRQKAEAQLRRRAKRVQRIAIKPLTPSTRECYIAEWREIEAQFVANPKQSVIGADQILCDIMGDRGYPVGSFEQRSADLSVDHPVLVQSYRAAHDIAVRQEEQGQTSTEDLRQAMLSYRELFDGLVGESLNDPVAVNGDAEGLDVDPDGTPETSTATAPVSELTPAELATTPAQTHAIEER